MRIVQLSDIHTGTPLFRPELLEAAIEETNAFAPDLVAVAGDLTTEGHRWEFEEAKGYLDRLECENVVIIMGNHDAKNVGYRHFEDLFGARTKSFVVAVPGGAAKVVSLDSTKPDLAEGEVGREYYSLLDAQFRDWQDGPKILVVHHHLLAIPGTGRDRNNLRDAGDVMAILRELKVDMVLSGHRHVPYVWSISGVRVVHSGTVSSMRTRGVIPPSYNTIEIGPETVQVTLRQPGGETEALARFSARSTTTSEVYPKLERFVRYDELPSSPARPRGERGTR